MPKSMLVRHAEVVITMDAARREIRDGAIFIEDHRIVAVGPTSTPADTADEVLDLAGHVVLPGLVNTHHHMFQSLTRAVPGAQDAALFGWLQERYPLGAGLTPDWRARMA